MPTTVFTEPSGSATTGGANESLSFRQFIMPTAGSLGQVRVTFPACSSTNLQCDHVSIAVQGTATQPVVQNTPTELLFGGVSGFTIAASGSQQSDWLTFNWSNGDTLCIINDMSSAGAGYGGGILYYFDNTAYSLASWQSPPSSASYNLADPGGGYANAGTYTRNVFLIETQAASGGGPVLGFGFAFDQDTGLLVPRTITY